MSSRRARWGVWLVLVALFTGCALVKGLIETETKLERAGIDNPSVDFGDFGDGAQVSVSYDSEAVDDAALQREYDTVLRIVWETAPIRIDTVQLVPTLRSGPTSVGQTTYTRAQLIETYGPRPAGLVEQDADSIARDLGRTVRQVVLVVVVVLLVGISLVVFFVVRHRRRRQALPQPGYPQWQPYSPPPAGYWPQPGSGYPPPQWPQPAPPQWPQPAPPQWQPPPPADGPAGPWQPPSG